MADDFLTAEEAANSLGIRVASLYAYVSRGMLTSEPIPGEPRGRRYRRQEIERLAARKALRRDPESAVPTALDFGAPLLESAITLIEGGRLYYRGRDASRLARSRSVEDVAALLWTGGAEDGADLFGPQSGSPPNDDPPQIEDAADGDWDPISRCQVALASAAGSDPGAWDLRPKAVPRTGVRIFRRMVAEMSAAGSGAAEQLPAAGTGAAAQLAACWAPERPEAAGLLRAALILCADHELNVSAFTARCVASAESSPYDVVIAGLSALRGRRHGGHTARVEALLDEVNSLGDARQALGERLRRGAQVPGFGHTLYPAGDPRAALLLELAAKAAPEVTAVPALVAAADEILGEKPTLDVGLVALAGALDLPRAAPLALFALGRTLGWIGHAIEQYAAGRLIRPRARYTGPAPG
ncbi:MAG: citrate synthase family protein [Acidobacteriota bacterium]